MRETEVQVNDARILYDGDAVAYVKSDIFDPARLAARGCLRGSAAGRGQTYFFRDEGNDYVLRHYRRGGKVAVGLDDRYLWTGLARTRAWREWRLLAKLTALGLPAPSPFAARVIRRGAFYRADLVTARIAHSQPLAAVLKARALPASDWREIGRVIARFHAAGVWHADLNAHNILLDSNGLVALIDFDRARFRQPSARWRDANLARLQRSLSKLKRLNPDLCSHDNEVELIEQGYESSMSRP